MNHGREQIAQAVVDEAENDAVKIAVDINGSKFSFSFWNLSDFRRENGISVFRDPVEQLLSFFGADQCLNQILVQIFFFRFLKQKIRY